MRKILTVLALTALAACGSDSPTGNGGGASLNGMYALTKVNGQNVPAVLADEVDYRYEITGGSLSISGGAYTASLSERWTIAGEVSTNVSTDAGTVVVSGSTITFTSSSPQPGAQPIAGSASGSTLTVGDASMQMQFQKQ